MKDVVNRRVILFASAFLLFIFDLCLVSILIMRPGRSNWVVWFYASVILLLIIGLFALMNWSEKQGGGK
jgi:quinol-cytochrome oxidoreductase complex cytochrome b subunit